MVNVTVVGYWCGVGLDVCGWMGEGWWASVAVWVAGVK